MANHPVSCALQAKEANEDSCLDKAITSSKYWFYPSPFYYRRTFQRFIGWLGWWLDIGSKLTITSLMLFKIKLVIINFLQSCDVRRFDLRLTRGVQVHSSSRNLNLNIDTMDSSLYKGFFCVLGVCVPLDSPERIMYYLNT